MATDVKFAMKDSIQKQVLAPVTVSEELRDSFLKKSRSSSWKLLPVSIIVSAVVIALIVLIIHFFERFVISAVGLIAVFFPIFAVYNIISTAKAIKNQDYEFVSGQIVGKTDSGYQVRGLEGHNISPFIGKKEYNPGEQVIVARLNDDLSLISEGLT
ncbi:MAG: hypothetical protein K6F79_10300 [Saccharofermentans sp.]|nr:hypothetical protein [Saccharofermentans sp.]